MMDANDCNTVSIHGLRSAARAADVFVEPRYLMRGDASVWIKIEHSGIRLADIHMAPIEALALVMQILDNVSDTLDVAAARKVLSACNRDALDDFLVSAIEGPQKDGSGNA